MLDYTVAVGISAGGVVLLSAASSLHRHTLMLRAFACGCTVMTGLEAVSNGVTIFANPVVKNAQRTLTAIVVILLALLAGIAYLCRAYGIAAMDESKPDYKAISPSC